MKEWTVVLEATVGHSLGFIILLSNALDVFDEARCKRGE